jgi:VWFA-related protein
MHIRRLLALVVFGVVIFLPALAQQTGAEQAKAAPSITPASQEPAKPVENTSPEGKPLEKPIQVQVNEVIVPVTVTDEHGRFVSDLDKNDFTILDEGQPQKIQFFSRERSQPIVIGFIMDMSNASRLQWKHYQESAMELALTLLPGDKKFSGFLISYSNEAELLVNTTSESEPIVEKMRKLKPTGGAALYDAIDMALTKHKMVKGEPIEPRRILVIIGDGHDNASKHTLDQVLELAQRDLVTIYGVSTVAFGDITPDEQNLVRLARETGGRVVSPLQKVYDDVLGYLSTPMDEGNYKFKAETGGYAGELAQGMFKAITDIAGEVTTQYILRYIPDVAEDKKTKSFRKIEVVVNLSGVRVRARKGYYPFNP